MSFKRALVECAVLSLQDSCVYYPSCKGCFSRIDVEQLDTTRCRCSKCGYSYVREQVDYRYRLSLRVARDTSIFGVTVFGTCLNQFFGLPASGLKRLVDSLDGPLGPSTRSTLLSKAVEDCFIGRHFIFGIKVTRGGEGGLWSGGSLANGSCGKDPVHFIASQMILPKATELTGCTVASYYRVLLQKAEEYDLVSTDTSKTSRPPAPTLVLIPHQSPSSSFNNTTFSASLLSLPRSPYQECTLTPTPPWEQSLGLITSSAEQEEGCGSQDSGKENSRWSDSNKLECQRGCPENHKPNKETTLSPLPAYNGLSFSRYPCSSIRKTINTPPPSASCTQLTKTFLSSSLAWDDLPFSESLTEFLCEKEKDFDNGAKTEKHLHVQKQTETTRSHQEFRSKDKKLSTESNLVCQSSAQITARQSPLLLDVTNIPASDNGGDRCDLSDRVCENSAGYVKRSMARSICSHDCNRDDEEAISSFENEQHPEGDDYNCSADLFSDSLMNDNTSVNAETVGMAAEDCTALSNDKLNAPHVTPHRLEHNICINTNSLISPSPQDVDFVPPSQSTPNVKLAICSGSAGSSHSSLRFTKMLGKIGSQPDSRHLCALYGHVPKSGFSKNRAKMTSSLCKANTANANHLSQWARESAKENLVWGTTRSRCSHRFTPKRSVWKSNNPLHSLLVRQCPRVPRGALNIVSTERITHMCDSSVAVCNYDDNELPVKMLQRQWTGDSSCSLNSTCEGQQGGGVMCKRTLLPQLVTSSQFGSVAPTRNCDSDLVGEEGLFGLNSDVPEDTQACDWSRDLFSDSIC